MPGPRGRTFPYHMTPSDPLGLVFTHYDYLSTFDNDIIEQTLSEAANKINQEIASNPALVNQTSDNGWTYEHNLPDESEDYYQLSIGPGIGQHDSAMTYGDARTVIALLTTWATQWRAVETDFEIWAWPGTGRQRRLGYGMLLSIF